MGYPGPMRAGSYRTRALSSRAKEAQIENELNFVCQNPLFFGRAQTF